MQLPMASLLANLARSTVSPGQGGALATLPSVGERITAYPTPSNWGTSGRPPEVTPAAVALCLWSAGCAGAVPALEGIERAVGAFDRAALGILVVAATDADGDAARGALRGAPRTIAVASANGRLNEVFGRAGVGPWRRAVPVPSIILLDVDRVVRAVLVGAESDPAMRGRRLIDAAAAVIGR